VGDRNPAPSADLFPRQEKKDQAKIKHTVREMQSLGGKGREKETGATASPLPQLLQASDGKLGKVLVTKKEVRGYFNRRRKKLQPRGKPLYKVKRRCLSCYSGELILASPTKQALHRRNSRRPQ